MGSLDRGGQETTIMHHYRHIDRNQVQFDFLLTDQPSAPENFESEALEMGARIFRRPMRSKHPYQNAKALWTLLKAHPEIQVVHIHNLSPLIAIDTWIAKRCHVPMRIAHSRCETLDMPRYQKMFRPLLRATATNWFTCSKQAGISLFGKKALNDVRFQILPNARPIKPFLFDSEIRQKKRKELGIDNHTFAWINVGRLTEQKNQLFLLEVFAQSLNRHKEQILMIAGAGDLLEKLQAKARALGIFDKVHFLGLRKDIAELLQAADLFLLPSLYEGLPGTVIEAQAAGLPCLIADTIAPESKITDLVQFLPIDKGYDPWTDTVAGIQKIDASRVNMDAMITRAGYDIASASARLMKLYQTEF